MWPPDPGQNLVKFIICNALALSVVASCCAGGETTVHRFGRQSMGTWGEILLAGPDSTALAPAADAALLRFERVDLLMSNWNPESELSKANRAAAEGCTLHPEIAPVLESALEIGRLSGGAFDITVEPLVRLWGFLGGEPRLPAAEEIDLLLPRIGLAHIEYDSTRRWLHYDIPQLRIDLGGIAKGRAVDLAYEELQARGVNGALINLSGNMRAIGQPPGRAHWVVGVRDPAGPFEAIASLALQGEAIATSGSYEQFVAADGRRYGHILDPRSGWPADQLAQVTVLAATAMEADAWATALSVLGIEQAVAILQQQADLHAICIRPDGPGRWEILTCSHLIDRLQLLPAAAGRFEVEVF